jgi:hypothetical protein
MVAEMNGLLLEHNGAMGRFSVVCRGPLCVLAPHAPTGTVFLMPDHSLGCVHRLCSFQKSAI